MLKNVTTYSCNGAVFSTDVICRKCGLKMSKVGGTGEFKDNYKCYPNCNYGVASDLCAEFFLVPPYEIARKDYGKTEIRIDILP